MFFDGNFICPAIYVRLLRVSRKVLGCKRSHGCIELVDERVPTSQRIRLVIRRNAFACGDTKCDFILRVLGGPNPLKTNVTEGRCGILAEHSRERRAPSCKPR